MIDGSECRCGRKLVPPRKLCPSCGDVMGNVDFEEKGSILTHTTLFTVPDGFSAPIKLALVELAGGPKLLCSCGDGVVMEIGAPVRVFQEGEIFICTPEGK